MHKIAYIAMAAKPYHIGHQCLVEIAAKNCEKVKLFVSTADRVRPGQHAVKNETMQKIWSEHLSKIIPQNVEILFVSSPVKSIYESLKEYELKENLETTHHIYADSFDINEKFSYNSMKKYYPLLFECGLLSRNGIERTSTVNISGTKMREYLKEGQLEPFIQGLPKQIQKDGTSIWKILGGA